MHHTKRGEFRLRGSFLLTKMSRIMIESEHHIPIARADTHPPSPQTHRTTVLEWFKSSGGTKRGNGDGDGMEMEMGIGMGMEMRMRIGMG